MQTLSTRSLLAAAAALAFAGAAQAQEKFTYLTNWYAQAEHGGFYQAVANGTYKKYGLDVTIKMGGPQVNILQLMAAGQADCVMGSSDLQMMIARSGGLPVTTLAAVFQKDPQVLIAHEDVNSFEEMKGKTILIAPTAQRGYWLWLKGKYGFTDSQTRPYTFNIQPFVADQNTVQQGYLTSEPFAIQKAGVKAHAFLFADQGWASYATTVSCMDETVKTRGKVLAAFVKAGLVASNGEARRQIKGGGLRVNDASPSTSATSQHSKTSRHGSRRARSRRPKPTTSPSSRTRR